MKKIESRNFLGRTTPVASFRIFIVNCEHISNFVSVVGFEQANVCWVHIEIKNTFEGKIGYIMRYVVVFSV